MALLVDEAHCNQTWGDEFRISFAEIGNLRSVIPPHVNIIGLTATSTQNTYETISEKLALQNPKLIVKSPERTNIFYRVVQPVKVIELATKLGEELIEKRVKFPKTVIFCRKYQDCSNLYFSLRETLESELTEPTSWIS